MCKHVEIVSVEEMVLIDDGVVEGEKWRKGCIGFFDVVKVDVECTTNFFDLVDGRSESIERRKEVSVHRIENDLVFVVMSVCPLIVLEEVLYVCGSVLDVCVGKIECGGHGV